MTNATPPATTNPTSTNPSPPTPSTNPNRPATTRRFTPARVIALALIAVLVCGLTYVWASSGPDRLSVPAHAKAGDLVLHACRYDTEDGTAAADCGTLVVPENRNDPHSRLIAVPVTRIKARSPSPGEPIFRLQGGPGLTNMTFAEASRYDEHHDVVLVGYRGVDGSSVLNCPEVTSALKHSTDFLATSSQQAYADAFRACSNRLQRGGVDLAGYSVPERVDDLEAARVAFGYGRIDLLSESAGTRTAMVYSWRHPDSINRSVMVGANPPGNFLWNPSATDEQVARYADLCSKDAACRDPHQRPDGLRPAGDELDPRPLGRVPDQARQRPDRVLLRSVRRQLERLADLRPDDDRLLAVGAEGRSQRLLADVPRRRCDVPERLRLG